MNWSLTSHNGVDYSWYICPYLTSGSDILVTEPLMTIYQLISSNEYPKFMIANQNIIRTSLSPFCGEGGGNVILFQYIFKMFIPNTNLWFIRLQRQFWAIFQTRSCPGIYPPIRPRRRPLGSGHRENYRSIGSFPMTLPILSSYKV